MALAGAGRGTVSRVVNLPAPVHGNAPLPERIARLGLPVVMNGRRSEAEPTAGTW
ncbi:hypothetical protein ACFXG6_35115 [Streptomyces roseus]|uniref:hypothetical protein n=1 Tax=Streptomyces roseus TaxID=66430 RepID=UPI0036A0AC82